MYIQHRLHPKLELNRFLYYDALQQDRIVAINSFEPWPDFYRDNVKAQLKDQASKGRWVGRNFIEEMTRQAFVKAPKESIGVAQDFGFLCLKELQSLHKLTAQTTKVVNGDGIEVTLTAVYEPETASIEVLQPSQRQSSYFYRVTIENHGDKVMQLLSRAFVFTPQDKDQPSITVPKWSPGVIGETPILSHGEGFTYMSWVKLTDSQGVMSASFRFTDLAGNLVEIDLGETELVPIIYEQT
jgi:uncharacterized protein affecting Mg2+/Co2+ transport